MYHPLQYLPSDEFDEGFADAVGNSDQTLNGRLLLPEEEEALLPLCSTRVQASPDPDFRIGQRGSQLGHSQDLAIHLFLALI